VCFCLYGFWGLFCVFLFIWVLRIILSIWVLRIVLCVFVYMGSEDCFVCFCLYGFWRLFCVFLFIWVLRIILCVFVSMGSEDCFVWETKTHKIILRTHIDKNTQNNPQNPYKQKHTKQSSEPIEDYFVCFCLYGFWGLFCVFLSIWVLRIVLCVFVYMGSEDCFVCLTKTHKTILRTHIDKNTQNNPQNPYRQKHTK
jgi:NhaP-type Na+/H+ or K+/H+ antiporter